MDKKEDKLLDIQCFMVGSIRQGGVIMKASYEDLCNGKFRNNTDIESVEIEEGVTKIGAYAFFGCASLNSVTIPDSVTEIEVCAFKCCTSLKSVTIPEGVTEIGDCAFGGCASLESVTIPEGVKVGRGAFPQHIQFK